MTASAKPAAVVIAHDYPVLRLGLRVLLEETGRFHVIGEVARASAAQQAAKSEAQLLVVDTSSSGITEIAEIVRAARHELGCHVLAVGASEHRGDACRALEAGALAYVVWTAPPEELLQACDHAAVGEPYVSPTIAVRLVRSRSVSDAIVLTDRESEMLAYLVAGETSRQMASTMHLSVRTVDALRSSVRQKLGTVDRASTIAAARRFRLIC